MSEQVERRVPAIRFKGFVEEWESQCLENMTAPVTGNSLSRARLNYKHGVAKNIHYGDILIRFGAVLDASRQDVPFITEQGDLEKLRASALQLGDVVFADAAEDQTVGKSVELVRSDKLPVFAGLHTITFRPTRVFAKGYLGYYTNSEAYRTQLYPLMQGTKVLSLSRSSLNSTSINYPKDLDEQRKISDFFKRLDANLNHHQTKLDKLKTLKQAMLQGMFPQGDATEPEIRFEGFVNKWVRVQVDDICELGRGRVISKTEINNNIGEYPVYSSQTLNEGVFGYLNTFDFEGEHITWTTDGVNAGTVFYREGKFNCTNVCGVLKLKDEASSARFFAIALNRVTYQHVSHALANPKLMNGVMAKINLLIPSDREQQKIGTYFRKLDELIALEYTQLDKLKQIKQSCLAGMFA